MATPPVRSMNQDKPSPQLLPIQQDFRWGYINRAGTLVIKPQFDSAEEFSDGLAFVRYPNREKPLKPGETAPEIILGAGFIDETGKVVLELESPFYLAGDGFIEGLTKFWTWEAGKGNLYGYIDKTGKVQIKPQFSYAHEFFEGLAAVCLDQKCGFIDKTGEFVIAPTYRMTFPFSDGFAVVSMDHEKVGFVNRVGELVIEPQFGNFHPVFKEGLAPVAYPNGKYGYIDTQGLLVIPMHFDQAQPFSEDLAGVSVNAKWGYIDKSGKFIIEPKFRSASPFSEGVAPVNSEPGEARTEQTGTGTGYIDKTGKMVITLKFDGALSFVGGIARVYVEGKFGYIDKKGNYIWKPTR